MQYARVQDADGRSHYGRIDGNEIQLLTAAAWLGGQPIGVPQRLAELTLCCPVEPSKIVCIGRNYAAHAAEMGTDVPEEPLLFFKPPSALIGPAGVVELPPAALSQRVEHEVELAVVVGRALKRASEAEAEAAIFGYTVAGDVTARDLQRSDKLWTRGKGFDTFCPCGPWIVSGLDVSAVAVRCRVNGQLRQDGNSAQMVFRAPALLAYISQVMTLLPGDLVLTGTPEGVAPLAAGDVVEMSVEGIGVLPFSVR